jgi:glutathione S-transferase
MNFDSESELADAPPDADPARRFGQLSGGTKLRTLLFTTGSPFARAVRIILDELNLGYEKREEITTPSVQQRAAASPTLQVPVYWDGDVRLWESGLIAEYLLHSYKKRPDAEPPLSGRAWRTSDKWRDKLILSTIQTIGTAITTISQMKWAGVAVTDNAHLTRSAHRLPHGMKWLEDQLPDDRSGFLPGCVSIQDIFLACHLRFAENRPIGLDPHTSNHPKISRLLSRLEERPSFRANPIWWWEPGVTGYEADGTPIYGR